MGVRRAEEPTVADRGTRQAGGAGGGGETVAGMASSGMSGQPDVTRKDKTKQSNGQKMGMVGGAWFCLVMVGTELSGAEG